ncbi:ankyrin repeat domain-containing protein 50-like [Phymastichus coffea]|uniref:ankyrin repeat domain-containing protein 50-like n=1 Tax=Phymastichus coffea TaxID=108790 RepID=UPI00273B8347|nr:ankyrin repeat domain-containing protein 50-like [Phymastichus coffea]
MTEPDKKIRFDNKLLDHIQSRRHDEAKARLSKDLINACDDEGSLLHYAAEGGNEVIVGHLIKLGADIDCLDRYGRTALVIAVKYEQVAVARELLEANADIHIASAGCQSALQMVLHWRYDNTKILQLFLGKMKDEAADTEHLVDRLLDADCSLIRAAYLNDTRVIQCMLRRGLDVNSRDPWNRTALHVACQINEIKLVKFLVEHGADVNSLDMEGYSPIMEAGFVADKETIKCLLDAGADPNASSIHFTLTTALFLAARNRRSASCKQVSACLELLFHRDVIPENAGVLFDMAHDDIKSEHYVVLINYLALLKELGNPTVDSLLHCNRKDLLTVLQASVESCQKFLRMAVSGGLSMLNLLTNNDDRMKARMRDSYLMSKLDELLSDDENKKLFPYYCNTLAMRLSKARRSLELENKAMFIISEMMNGSLNQFYIVVRIIVSYLNDDDLLRLTRIYHRERTFQFSSFNMTDKNEIHFDVGLLNHIRFHSNDEAKLMLNNDLVNACDDNGTLLHYATTCSNRVIVKHLIECGAEVDYLNKAGETCLMLAVRKNVRSSIVKVLLEANADIYKTDHQGRSVLQTVCDPSYPYFEILELILRKLRGEIKNTEKFVDELVTAGCSFYHAVHLGDFQVMRCMLQRGFDVNSKGYCGRTALHVVAMRNEMELAKILIDHGADVNVSDDTERTPFIIAVQNRHKDILRLVLEAGADPNGKYDFSPVFILFMDDADLPNEDSDECLELLFQYGVIIENSSDLFRMGVALNQPKKINILVNYLTMLQEVGKPIPDSKLQCHSEKFRLTILELVDSCRKFLKTAVFKNSSILKLLMNGDSNMRRHVRNHNFVSHIQQLLSNDENKKLFPYYCSTIAKRVSKAKYFVSLENKAISIVSIIMNSNQNLFYAVACKVIEYLNDKDLKKLVHGFHIL